MDSQASSAINASADVAASPIDPTIDVFGLASSADCCDALSLLDDLPCQLADSGWWILKRIKQNQLLVKFENNSTKAARVFNQIFMILDKYYVNAYQYLCKLCRENNVPEDQMNTTTNEAVAAFRVKYSRAINQNEFVCVDIPLPDLSIILVNLNSLFASICMICMQFKSPSIASNIQSSYHVPMLVPFNHDVDLLFSKIKVTPNPQFAAQMESDPEPMFNKVPYMFVTGHVALICEIGESRGTNTARQKFKVLNLIDPSLSILRDHFNRHVRRLFPDYFSPDKLSPHMFIQLSESQSTPTVSCMEPHQGKKVVLVLANLAHIYLVKGRSQIVPQLQIWTNVKLAD
jgi:hypothetical protein